MKGCDTIWTLTSKDQIANFAFASVCLAGLRAPPPLHPSFLPHTHHQPTPGILSQTRFVCFAAPLLADSPTRRGHRLSRAESRPAETCSRHGGGGKHLNLQPAGLFLTCPVSVFPLSLPASHLSSIHPFIELPRK